MHDKHHHHQGRDVPDRLIGEIARRLRTPPPVSSEFDERVMAEVRANAVRGNGRDRFTPARRWPRPSWRGAVLVGGVGALVATALLTLLPPWLRTGTGRRTHVPMAGARLSPVVSPPARCAIHFTFTAPHARQVTIAGSFNGWNTRTTPMRRVGDETWVADVPLGAGRYTYMFVVDGVRWLPDPSALRDAPDDFGAANSVVLVADKGAT